MVHYSPALTLNSPEQQQHMLGLAAALIIKHLQQQPAGRACKACSASWSLVARTEAQSFTHEGDSTACACNSASSTTTPILRQESVVDLGTEALHVQFAGAVHRFFRLMVTH